MVGGKTHSRAGKREPSKDSSRRSHSLESPETALNFGTLTRTKPRTLGAPCETKGTGNNIDFPHCFLNLKSWRSVRARVASL